MANIHRLNEYGDRGPPGGGGGGGGGNPNPLGAMNNNNNQNARYGGSRDANRANAAFQN